MASGEYRRLCETHPDVDWHIEWGCPRCLAELRDADHAAAEEARRALLAVKTYDAWDGSSWWTKERLELAEDAIDWMKRWQAGRFRNNKLRDEGMLNTAKVILDAGKMNEELDRLLAAWDALEEAGHD